MPLIKRLILAVLVLVLVPTGGIAQDSCTRERLNAAIDAYAFDPFGVRAWRKMNGIGDPMIEPGSVYDDTWQQREDWKKLVGQIAPELTDIQEPGYECRIGYPLAVLKDRIAKFGANDPYLKRWFYGQASVVRACSSGQGHQVGLQSAEGLKPEQAELFKHDATYQAASVAFYTDKPKAIELFKAIGASNSPHRAAARYNVANLFANARNVSEARREVQSILADPSLASIHDITEQLDGYIANIEDTAEGWSGLIDRTVAILSSPKAEIEKSSDARKRYANALYDVGFLGMGAKQGDWWITNTLPENPTLSAALVDASRKHPMVLWMMTGQTVDQHFGKAPWTFVGERWRTWNASLIDRALALQPANSGISEPPRQALAALKVGLDDESRAALWREAQTAAAAARTSCGEAAETGALASLATHAVRSSAQSGQFEEIYKELPLLDIGDGRLYREVLLPKLFESILASGDVGQGRRLRDNLSIPKIVTQMVSSEESTTKEKYARFLEFVAEDRLQWLSAVQMQSEKLSSPIFNLLSANELRALSNVSGWTPQQQALLARAAWTRDYARGKAPGKRATDSMLALNPEIKKTVDAIKQEFPGIREDDLWTLTILRTPRFGIMVNSPDWTDPIEAPRGEFAAIDYFDHNDKNWWCPLQVDRNLAAVRVAFDEASGIHAASSYHADELKHLLEPDDLSRAAKLRDRALKSHPMVRTVNWNEVRQLSKTPSAPKALSLAAIAMAKSGRQPSAAAEALGRAVTVTRYGCNWHGPHGKYSKAAQELLKGKFPQSDWASKTPYWFDCMAMTWDEQYNRVPSCKPKVWPKQEPLR